MINVEKILTKEVKEAREAVPCRSRDVMPIGTSINDLDSLHTRVRGAQINDGLKKCVVGEREKIVQAIEHRYGEKFLTWFCGQVESGQEKSDAKPSVVIVNEMLLPENRKASFLTVEGLAVAIALYDLGQSDYSTMPQSLLVSSIDSGYDVLVGSAMARNAGVTPTDFAVMGPPVDA